MRYLRKGNTGNLAGAGQRGLAATGSPFCYMDPLNCSLELPWTEYLQQLEMWGRMV